MNSVFTYWAFGLTFASELEFPELLGFDLDGTADVNITWGKVPEQFTGNDVINAQGLAMNATQYLLKIQDVAFYYVENGSKVVIERQPGADDKTIRLYLLSNVMAALLHQKDAIPLHASAVAYNDGLALFCGDSGAGKSTTITAMQQKGYQIFSDDICVLRLSCFLKENICAWPSYPVIKLWENSYQVTGTRLDSNEYQLRAGIPKYARFYHGNFSREPQTIKHIFILETNPGISHPQETKLNAGEAFEALISKTYRPVQVSGMNKRKVNFSIIAKLAGGVPVSRLTRPVGHNSIDAITHLIENRLRTVN